MKAAGEFRIKRQQYARRKHVAIVRDASADAGSRLRNLSRVAENYFRDISCGHGMCLSRIHGGVLRRTAPPRASVRVRRAVVPD
ncbi:hypothetical protein [Haladaptatus halobius]|uniref:hypothetical protein n=1 Tax=Haladaptatus halobius TaxID=2884875 RepID=UPI001D0A51F0|nr:hypothetical protein [Haladaptatus halobius]